MWGLLGVVGGAVVLLLVVEWFFVSTAVFAQDRLSDVLLMPISVILMTRIAWRSLRWHFGGGVQWKGRQINTAR